MEQALLQKLKKWRAAMAQKENTTLFRVFPNKVLDDLVKIKPKNKDEMLAIKGIRERKFEKYGADVLAIVSDNSSEIVISENQNKPYSVSDFLDLLNKNLTVFNHRIQGEISSFNIKDYSVYFCLKDKTDESTLYCYMRLRDYQLCGIELEVGMEIIVNGYPSIYKPFGKLSLQVSVVELVGEGALKKAYEELKKKLAADGLFAPERKKPISDLPQKIGLITSETGAVIHDFLTNLGKFGFQIKLVDSRVEGQVAVSDLIAAIDYFDDKDIDVLVIIRGGGSLESLQAFNNEALVRKIADCAIPVLCGIGHDKDVPLASYAADLAVSTPTAAANFLNKSWNETIRDLTIFEKDLMYKYQEALRSGDLQLEGMADNLQKYFSQIFQRFNELRYRLRSALDNINFRIKDRSKILDDATHQLLKNFKQELINTDKNLDDTAQTLPIRLENIMEDARKGLNNLSVLLFKDFSFLFKNANRAMDQFGSSVLSRFWNGILSKSRFLDQAERTLKISDPRRQLKLGYSIASVNGQVIRSIQQVKAGDSMDIQVSDGKINSTINKK